MPIRSIRTFVHRGRRLSQTKQEVFDSLADRYILAVSEHSIRSQDIFSRSAPVIFEIGFGFGDSLLDLALSHPYIDYIGAEVHQPGVAAFIAKLAQHNVTNVRIYQNDALIVLKQCIADASLAGINIFFPDPWPKRRHHKRRLMQVANIALFARKLMPGGFLHFATDCEGYANDAMALLLQSQDFVNEVGENYVLPHTRGRAQTKFEKRAEKLGNRIWDICFIRK